LVALLALMAFVPALAFHWPIFSGVSLMGGFALRAVLLVGLFTAVIFIPVGLYLLCRVLFNPANWKRAASSYPTDQ
jgi:uncharacterized membrane protein